MTLDPTLRHWHTRLDNLNACEEHAPEGLYATALAVHDLLGATADHLIDTYRKTRE